VGAVATQAFSETGHGPNGLAQLREGRTPAEALAVLMAADGGESVRQVGIVSAAGLAAAHTGARCVQAAGHATAPDASCQANMMERPTVWPAMLAAFSSATGDLADRMLVALQAAEAEGGDVRGHQSAALLVVPGRAGAPPWEHRFDVRVDDAADPLAELARLLRLSRAYEGLEAATDARYGRRSRSWPPAGMRMRGPHIARRLPPRRGRRSTCAASWMRVTRPGRPKQCGCSWRDSSWSLLPLDGRRRLRRDVVDDPVYARYLVDDP
jgi:uncharacterized Ntn-hydrolase superfamily protein